MLKISLLAEELRASKEKPYSLRRACLANPCPFPFQILRIRKFHLEA